ncbi:MAG: bifunctional phosphoribosyl-AMP cyclohydrolase/phosphoribosyl-ATP diphosphatase HisIE [Gemmatimonadota bacterium]|nr:bifunctional phosphoribosyl-AMP cyclohydrolase/phosphoribosyl-ATP diphosphatase HisIE [Gemmatimonadota bacterium]
MTDRTLRTPADLDAIDFDKADGLVPVVAQDARTGAVLMVAYANRDALARSLDSGRMHYWSRSRSEIWRKGDTSGHVQHVVSLHGDCDADTVLAVVRQEGPACHTGEATCFGEGSGPASAQPGSPPAESVLARLDAVLADRAAQRPEGSYTVKLLTDENLRLKKLGEECAELVTALAKNEADRIPEEAADLVYHVLVAARAAGVGFDEIANVLEERGS